MGRSSAGCSRTRCSRVRQGDLRRALLRAHAASWISGGTGGRPRATRRRGALRAHWQGPAARALVDPAAGGVPRLSRRSRRAVARRPRGTPPSGGAAAGAARAVSSGRSVGRPLGGDRTLRQGNRREHPLGPRTVDASSRPRRASPAPQRHRGRPARGRPASARGPRRRRAGRRRRAARRLAPQVDAARTRQRLSPSSTSRSCESPGGP